MTVPLLPEYTGDPNSIRDIIAYIVNPANAGLLDLDEKITILTALVGDKTTHTISESPPTAAEKGYLWTKESTGVTRYCHTAYTEAEPDPDSQWNVLTDPEAQTTLQTMAQLSSPTPQVTLLQQTMAGIVDDESVSVAEKATVKLVYDELVARKTEIDLAATRYSLTGTANYIDYVASYTAWRAYIDTTLDLFNDMGSATAVSPSVTWTANFNAVLADEADILNAIRSAAQDVIDTISGDLSTTQAQIDEMTTDGVISPTEKLRFRDEWARVQDEYNQLSAQATLYSLTGDTEWVNLNAAYTDLSTYLGAGETDVFSNMAIATTLTGVGSNSTEWLEKWQTYWLTAKVFDTHVDEYFSGLISTQQSALDALVASIDSLSNDGIISGGTEKQDLKAKWQEIVRLNTQILYNASLYGVSTPATYSTAYTDLDTYLNTTLDVFNDMTSDTTVVRATFNAFFEDYETQYDLFSQTVADAQKVAVDSEPASYGTYTALIDSLVDDGIISAGMEKTQFNALWLDMQATHAIIKAKADNVGVNTTGFQAAYDDLASYIGGLVAPGGSTPNFTIEGEDTAIGVSTWYSKIRTYEQSKSQLESDVVSTIINLQQDAAAAIVDINDDGIVSPPEKKTSYTEFQRLTSLKAQLETQADSLSITTEKTNMTTAYNTLETYLNSLDGGDGLFNDMGASTTLTQVERDNWDTNWNNIYSTIAILETAIVSTITGNVSAVGSNSFFKDGSTPATGNFDMDNNKIQNLSETTPASGIKDAATVGQIHTEQVARGAHEALTSAHGVSGDVVGTTDNQTLTAKGIDADNNTITNLETDNLKDGVMVTNKDKLDGSTLKDVVVTGASGTTPDVGDAITSSGTGVGIVSEVISATSFVIKVTAGVFGVAETLTSGGWTATVSTSTDTTAATNTELAGAQAVGEAMGSHKHGLDGDVVGTTDSQTLEGKTIDGDNNTLSLGVGDFKTAAKYSLDFGPSNDPDDENSSFPTAEAVWDKFQTIVSDAESAVNSAVASLTEDFGVEVAHTVTGPASTYNSNLLGTGIDVNSDSGNDFLDSAFTLKFDGHFDVVTSNAPGRSLVSGFLMKRSGTTDILVRAKIYYPIHDGTLVYAVNTARGTLTGTASPITVVVSPQAAVGGYFNPSGTFGVRRVDDNDELCFRIELALGASQSECEFDIILSGPRNYGGPSPTGNNGTKF